MLKRTIPILILATSGAILVVAYFSPFTTNWSEVVLMWFNILAAVAYVLGAGNLLAVNLEKVSSRRAGWAYALITLVAFASMLTFGLFKIGGVPSEAHPDVPYAGDYESTQSAFGWVYEYMLSPLTATMFALLAFYVASAAFRAFRAKNLESILLLGTAFIILLAQTAAGMFLTGWIPADSVFAFLRFDSLRIAITEYIQTAGMRAITIGIAIGIAATSLRLILGVDRSYLSKQ
ncbi:MAG: hypothetical protein DWI10_03950 [Planctomycetota bacterium]|nr:MAG: hypothetical protein DWI10_03950 [Planctomycetota bacterium]